MIIFSRTLKERFVTVGVLLSLGALAALSIRLIYLGGWDSIFSLVGILISVAILKGIKFGYTASRFIFGALAIIMVGGTLSPFTYGDALLAAHGDTLLAKSSFLHQVFEAMAVAALSVFLFYSLGEHSKLRGVTRS